MAFESILITGGAGFVGSSLAIRFKGLFPQATVTAFDNLHRRGSELNLPRLQEAGIRFRHGDIRSTEDIEQLDDFDVLIDCAAEPSVQAGVGESPRYVLNNNLVGTIHCLEAARVRKARFVLLSTSRVYPMAALNRLPFVEDQTRFRWDEAGSLPGFSRQGVAEDFPLAGARSFYGASKLASELLLQEYVFGTGMQAVVNRCGILAGPWQMGKVDQGVITLWVAHHYFQRPLRYTGYGGSGKQVRDLLHVDDLFDLLVIQLRTPSVWDGRTYNIGGGSDISVSLCELTELCAAETGRRLSIAGTAETSSVDLRIYLSDCRKAANELGWRPSRNAQTIVRDIHHWIDENRACLEKILCKAA
jgi:CDP-paratose 2-epimerase